MYIYICIGVYLWICPRNNTVVDRGFASWQYLKLYQDGHRLVTVHTYGGHYSAALLGYHITSIINRYSTQSHYHDTEIISPVSILSMLGASLGS